MHDVARLPAGADTVRSRACCEQHIHWAHRLSTLVGFGAVGLRRPERDGRCEGRLQGGYRTASMVLLGLYGLQMLIGAANIWTTFSDVVRASHLAVSAVDLGARGAHRRRRGLPAG